MRESAIESLLRREVAAAGGMSAKLVPTVAGLPDRLVILNGVHLVELKTDTGKLRPVQIAWHRRAAERGVQVVVLHGPGQVRAWVKGLTT